MKGALIIAGGRSTRFGSDKALAELNGKALLSHVTHTATQVAREVVVAIGRESSVQTYKQFLPPSVHIVKDKLRMKAPLVGILTGFQIMKSEYSAVLSCDTPFAKDDVLRLLFKKATRSDAAIPKWPNGDLEPLQAVYRVKSAIPAAIEALSCRRFGIVDMINGLGRVTYVPMREIGRLDRRLVTFLNVNRWSDLGRAEALRFDQNKT